MHRLHSKSAILRFRLAALLLCLRNALIPVTGGVLGYSVIVNDDKLTVIALGMTLLAVLVMIVQWLVATRTNCPLCLTPVLAKKRCAKHRHARRFLGSHRLRVALAVLCKNSFRCPYCHEPTALEVRNDSQTRPYSRS